MEMEPCSPPIISNKLWNIVKIVLLMSRKGISKCHLLLNLQALLKRGKIAGKAITNLMLHHHHYSAVSCRSDHISLSFVSPQEYEFICSSSPVFPSYYTKRRYHHHQHRRDRVRADNIDVVQKVFDKLNKGVPNGAKEIPETSPVVLPGFGRSPVVRQLRITDSPFPLKDAEDQEDTQVDKAAEEFIKKFYEELKRQKRMASLRSPSPYHLWAS